MKNILSVLIIWLLGITGSGGAVAAPRGFESYDDVSRKGRIRVVTFFAHWSESSLELMRKMDGMRYGKPADVDFDLVGILVDEDQKPSRKSKEAAERFSMPIVHDRGMLVRRFSYSSGSVGMVLVLDAAGNTKYSSYHGNKDVEKDVMAAVTELSRAKAKADVLAKVAADPMANCEALKKMTAAAGAGNLSSLGGLSLPQAEGEGSMVDNGYEVVLAKDFATANGDEIKKKIEWWSAKIKACLPGYRQGESSTGGGMAELLGTNPYTLPEPWFKGDDLRLEIKQLKALSKTNVVLRIMKAY
jgi:hypothetical protein